VELASALSKSSQQQKKEREHHKNCHHPPEPADSGWLRFLRAEFALHIFIVVKLLVRQSQVVGVCSI